MQRNIPKKENEDNLKDNGKRPELPYRTIPMSSFPPGFFEPPQNNKIVEKDQNKREHVEMEALRQRQRELGLLDKSGNLYDPMRKQWVSPSFMAVDEVEYVENLYKDLHYFEHYPEMKNGLPAGTVYPEYDPCESSFSENKIY